MSYTNLSYHIVFSTKGRQRFLSPKIMSQLTQYIGGIVRNLKGHLVAANGDADHLHLACVVPPTAAIAEFVGKVKSNSSAWIHEALTGLKDFDWQDGYAAFSVSKSVLPEVIRYIESQEEHHHKMTFQEEFVALLKRHGVEYDERYLWK